MKQKLQFLGNLMLLAILDVAIVLNIKQIYENGLQMSILGNILLLIFTAVTGVVVLQDAYKAGRQIVFERRVCAMEEDLYDYEDEEYLEMEE